MGTPDFAVPTLTEVVGRGHQVVAVYTRPPQPAGRGMSDRLSPINEAASRLGLGVVMPRSLRVPAVEMLFAEHAADVAVVVAYGLILPKSILEAPRFGCLNLHASLLPRWRGAAPIQRALLAGDRETGVMVMRMEEGLDTGPVCFAKRAPIAENDTAGTLHDRLAVLGADLMGRALATLENGGLNCAPQSDEGVTYAAKIAKTETRIDWTRPAGDILNQVRGLSPFPGAWCEMPFGGKRERIKVLRASLVERSGEPGRILNLDPLTVACGTGALALIEVQRAGRGPILATEFLRGARLKIGALLT
jgi:methionyl-tRNA formyltransferase